MTSLPDEGEEPPWPGLVKVPGQVVRVPACELWAEHESYAAPCWLAARAQPPDDHNVAAPTLPQLLAALAAGTVEPSAAPEQTSSAFTVAALDAVEAAPPAIELALSATGLVERAGTTRTALVRQAILLAEPKRPWWQLARPCVPRDGRGATWAAVCEPRSGDAEPRLLDRGEVVARVHQDGAWILVAATADDHPFGWVPATALSEWVDPWVGGWSGEADAQPRSGHDDDAAQVSAVLAGTASDAPLIDAMLALAAAAAERLLADGGGAAQPSSVPEHAAQLLEAWAAFAAPLDPRLASLSATDILLLAITAAPALDRRMALRYHAIAPDLARTVGGIVDLAGASAAGRVRATRRLVRDQPLRGNEVLLVSGGHVPTSASEIAVANWVLAVLYGLVS